MAVHSVAIVGVVAAAHEAPPIRWPIGGGGDRGGDHRDVVDETVRVKPCRCSHFLVLEDLERQVARVVGEERRVGGDAAPGLRGVAGADDGLAGQAEEDLGDELLGKMNVNRRRRVAELRRRLRFGFLGVLDLGSAGFRVGLT
jgi:hypothetical protein